jgi:ketosteroid isomerase-like protein
MSTTTATNNSLHHSATSAESSDDWQETLLALEEESRVAFLNADVATLDRLWADDFVVNSPLNMINERAMVLALVSAGHIRHTSCEVEIERLARYGDVAVVMGADVVEGPPTNERTHRRFTNIWQLQDGTWRAIARHAQVYAGPNAR